MAGGEGVDFLGEAVNGGDNSPRATARTPATPETTQGPANWL